MGRHTNFVPRLFYQKVLVLTRYQRLADVRIWKGEDEWSRMGMINSLVWKQLHNELVPFELFLDT
jgi:hypothetical protein